MHMLRTHCRTGLLAGLLIMAITATLATIQVELNGQRLAFSVPPTQMNGRTMVPLRGIFEALGAQVRWDGATQTITAGKDATDVQLVIGNPHAIVNSRTVVLDAPAIIQRGTTLVPLRFVSEALGANVQWNSAAQLVAITTTPSQANTGTVSLPLGTVIPMVLDQALSSATSMKGDAVTATVRSTQEGDAEFPLGTKFNGIVSEVSKKTEEQPGVLALTFHEALLPDGQKVPLTGSLYSLDEKDIIRSADGHLIAKDKTVNDTLKFIAIGTGAGLIIGKLMDKNLITSGLIGAVAGYIYSATNKDQVITMDVTVKEGTAFGVRLDRELLFTTSRTFITAREAYLKASTTPAPVQ